LSLKGWSDVAHNFRGDWQMLWKEIGAGFLIAGFVALLPQSFFNSLFLTGHGGALQVLENVLVGPLVAVLSFVCSVGNVPLAAVLWAGGISFSGVIAFIYADLIIVPLLIVYQRYYGWRVAGIIAGLMFGAMVTAALAVDGLFSALGLVPSTRPSIGSIVERPVTWNYTAVLNIVFTLVAAGLLALTLRRGERDPICGMTVDRGKALSTERDGKRYFFCGPGCRSKFEAKATR
jgi:YHS domain-containing protein